MTTLVEREIKTNSIKDFDENTVKWLLKNGYEAKTWSYNGMPYYAKGLLKIEPYESVFAPKRFYAATIIYVLCSNEGETNEELFEKLEKDLKQANKDLRRFVKFTNEKGE